MSARVIAALALGASLLLAPAVFAAKALLIGVAEYPPPVDDLEGPVHDVRAVARILERHWGLSASDVRALLDSEATRSNILAEIDALFERSAVGEHVLIYFSGHGTSAFDPRMGLPLPTTSGALVPFLEQRPGTPEQWLDALIIGRRDLNPRFKRLDAGGRRVLVVIDACYSGNTVRGAFGAVKLPSRYANISGGFPDYIGPYGSNTAKRATYPYDNVFYLAASGENEVAKDISSAYLTVQPTFDGRPHGAFTDALARVLSGRLPADANGDGALSYDELYQALRAFMGQQKYGHTPVRLPGLADRAAGIATRSLFGRRAPARPASPGRARGGFSVAVEGFPGLTAALRRRGIVVQAQDATLRVRREEERGATLLIAPGGDLITRLPTLIPAEVEAAVLAQQGIHAWVNAPFNDDFLLSAGVQGVAVGSTLVAGDKIGFSVQPERAAYLVLVNIGPTGGVQVLYPWSDQKQRAPAARLKTLHDIAKVNKDGPFGREIVDIYAFENWPAGLDRHLERERYDPDSPEARALRQTLMRHKGSGARETLTLYSAPEP